MNQNFLLSATFLLGLAGAAGAQTGGLMQNTLTNHDILVLAQAGFNENFIADYIAMSRTRFDTSVTGLAEMAKEGLAESLIRVILAARPAAGNAASGAGAPAPIAAGPATTVIVPAGMIEPPAESRGRSHTANRSESAMATGPQAPYYRTSSIFWGLWSKKIGVGAAVRSGPSIGAQLGTAYGQIQAMNPAGARYVVIP